MPKRMTVVFDDDELYVALKVAAVKGQRHAKDIVADAVREWLESQEDEELRTELEDARAEWRRDGGVDATELLDELVGDRKI